MNEPVYSVLPRPFQQHMCPIDVRICKLVRVAEAEIDVRLRGKMEDGVDLMFSENTLHICGRSDVALLEGEIGPAIEDTSVVQASAVIELVERDDIVAFRVGES
jgi:hypothetical protein